MSGTVLEMRQANALIQQQRRSARLVSGISFGGHTCQIPGRPVNPLVGRMGAYRATSNPTFSRAGADKLACRWV